MTWSNTVSKRGGGVVDWEDLDDDQEAEEEEEMDVADAQVIFPTWRPPHT